MKVFEWRQAVKADGGGWERNDVIDVVSDTSRCLESEIIATEAEELGEEGEIAKGQNGFKSEELNTLHFLNVIRNHTLYFTYIFKSLF